MKGIKQELLHVLLLSVLQILLVLLIGCFSPRSWHFMDFLSDDIFIVCLLFYGIFVIMIRFVKRFLLKKYHSQAKYG